MDYSKLSDDALKMMASGQVDYSKLSDSDLSVIAGKAPQAPGKLESLARGAGQGLSLGFEDELRAAVMAPFSDKNYSEIRDEIRGKNESARRANPKLFMTGEIGGGVATSFVPGLNMGKAATALGAAARGAGFGALNALGTAEGDMDKQALQTAAGGALGGILGGIGQKVTKALQNKAPQLAELATGATGREQQLKFKEGSGRKLLDLGIVSWGNSPKGIAKKSAKLLEQSSDDIGKSLKALDMTNIQVPKEEVISNLAQVRTSLDDIAQKDVISKIDDVIEDFSKSQKPLTFSDVWNKKKLFEKKVNWIQKAQDPSKAQANEEIASALRMSVDNKASVLSPELATKFKAQRELYGLLKPVTEASERRASQLAQSPMGGFLDMTSGAIGAASSGNPLLALPAAIARRVASPRLASTLAKTADSKALQNAIQRVPVVTGTRQPLSEERLRELFNLIGEK